MSSKDFHKSMDNYLDVRRNGPRSSSRKRKEKDPISRIIMARVRQIRRKLRIIFKKLVAFFGADHELDLNTLNHDVFVIERDEPTHKVFWRQFKSLFKQVEKQIKAPIVMHNHLFQKKERLRNEQYRTSSKKQDLPEDVDMSKVNEVIKNNSL